MPTSPWLFIILEATKDDEVHSEHIGWRSEDTRLSPPRNGLKAGVSEKKTRPSGQRTKLGVTRRQGAVGDHGLIGQRVPFSYLFDSGLDFWRKERCRKALGTELVVRLLADDVCGEAFSTEQDQM